MRERREIMALGYFLFNKIKMPKKKTDKPKRRMKPLLPSLKEKKRYLAFEVISKKALGNIHITNQISEACLRFLGAKGVAEAGVIFLKYDKEKQRGLIRVNNKYIHNLKTALALISEIDKNEVIIRGIGVSGILNKAEKRYLAS